MAESAIKAPSILTKSIGPLPGWVWAVSIVGGLGVAYFINSRAKSSKEDGIPMGEDGEYYQVPNGQAAAVFANIPPPVVKAPETLDEWAVRATAFLISRFPTKAYLVQQAIRKYIQGENVTEDEAAIIQVALTEFGAPPQLPTAGEVIKPPPPPVTKPPTTTPPTTTKPPTTAPPARYYTVQTWPAQGSTLWGIATIYYGNGTLWTKIYNANRDKISNPDLIYPGQKLLIPY